MTMSDFEDPRDLLRCIQSDCERPRAGNTPFCAQHLREQEIKSPGIVEPDVEARVAKVRTEDDDHPGMVKVYDRETGEPSWVPAEDAPARTPPLRPARIYHDDGTSERIDEELYVGPDPDVNGLYRGYRETDQIPDGAKEILLERPPATGVWVAATTTRIMIFDNELGALRYAVANQAKAEFVPFNTELQLPQ